MDLKKIKQIPFGDFLEKSMARWKVVVRQPVAGGERLLAVDFLNNPDCTGYKRETASFRVVCGKKNGEAKGIVAAEGGKPLRATGSALESLYRCRHEYVSISERDEAALSRFLGKGREDTGNHQIDNLADWVRQAGQAQKERQRRERGGLMAGDYRLCPEALPAGLLEYIRDTVLPNDNVLVYKKGNVRGLCYACGKEVRAKGERFKQGARTACPHCGTAVGCVLEGSDAFLAENVENVVAMQKGTDGETVFFRQWRLLRDPTARWERIGDFLKETARYAVRGKNTAKWQKETKENSYMHCERYDLDGWTLWQGNRIYDNAYYFCPAGAEEALRGTAMQYADLQGYLEDKTQRYKNSIYFLEYHAKYPVMEFLWKRGYRKIVRQRIGGMSRETRDAVLWKRECLRECFRFPLRFLRAKPPGEWTLEDIARLNSLWQAKGGKLGEDEAALFLEAGIDTEDVLAALPYAPLGKMLRYIKKQTGQRQAAFVKRHDWDKPPGMAAVAHEYRDYLDECTQLGLAIADQAILFPKDLKAAHERTMAQASFEKNKADQEKFQKAVGKLEQFAWEKDGLSIRPARTQEELAQEGKYLHHCVAGYIKRMASGETAIFFVRKTDAPDTPYFTLELQKKRVIQCRTKHNASYAQNPEVLAFVKEWEREVVAGMAARGGCAAGQALPHRTA